MWMRALQILAASGPCGRDFILLPPPPPPPPGPPCSDETACWALNRLTAKQSRGINTCHVVIVHDFDRFHHTSLVRHSASSSFFFLFYVGPTHPLSLSQSFSSSLFLCLSGSPTPPPTFLCPSLSLYSSPLLLLPFPLPPTPSLPLSPFLTPLLYPPFPPSLRSLFLSSTPSLCGGGVLWM